MEPKPDSFEDCVDALKKAVSAYADLKRLIPRLDAAMDTSRGFRSGASGATHGAQGCSDGGRREYAPIRRVAEWDGTARILDAARSVTAIGCLRYRLFLAERTGSERVANHLYVILCGGRGSLRECLEEEARLLESLHSIQESATAEGDDGNEAGRLPHGGERARQVFSALRDNTRNILTALRMLMRDLRHSYRVPTRVNIVGYGEISTALTLDKEVWSDDGHESSKITSDWIWKKMPPFPTFEEVERFDRLYREYRCILNDTIGIRVPDQRLRWFRRDGFFVVYAGQRRLNAHCVGHTLVRRLDTHNALAFFQKILHAVLRVHRFNNAGRDVMIGFDAQLSNWVLDSKQGIPESIEDDDGLWYIDTSSPLIRIKGMEQVNTELFIKSAASFLRSVIRAFFLQEVLDRYYDMRSAVVDVIANLYKEKRPDLIDVFIERANSFIQSNGIADEAITRKEIDRYYSQDAFIWRFYQASRRIDRFLTEKIAGKPYLFRIPEKIER